MSMITEQVKALKEHADYMQKIGHLFTASIIRHAANTIEQLAAKVRAENNVSQPCEDAIGRSDMLDAIGHGTTYTSKELQKIIKALPPVNPQPKTGWIPVSDRLPEFSIEVLTCSNGGFIEIQSLEESYGDYWENQKGDWSDFDEIIAWMPLPKPFEPQESEEV